MEKRIIELEERVSTRFDRLETRMTNMCTKHWIAQFFLSAPLAVILSPAIFLWLDLDLRSKKEEVGPATYFLYFLVCIMLAVIFRAAIR